MRNSIFASIAFALVALPVHAAFTVTLTPSLPSPQPLGTTITWKANVTDSAPGAHTYRFSAGLNGQPLDVRQDFGSLNTWTWTPTALEGSFQIQVIASNSTNNSTATRTATYQLTSRLASGAATANPTNHPLVALFSAPACRVPNVMQVRFQRVGAADSEVTAPQACRFDTGTAAFESASMNFLVAGMYPSTTYLMKWETLAPNGTTLVSGTPMSFTTGVIPATVNLPPQSVQKAPPASDNQQNIVLQSVIAVPRAGSNIRYPVYATDLLGNPLWYSPTVGIAIDRIRIGGNMLGLDGEYLRELDVAGNSVLNTNVTRVSQQLVARGMRPITGFHHDVRRINNPGKPNDNFIVVLGADELVSTTLQGGTPAKPVDIVGDVVIVLDKSLQVVWAWDAFEHLDVSRTAILNETCNHNGPGCEPFSNAFTESNDWLHANSVQFTPWDGNFIVSLRHQDWVIKINYANGAGDGSVLWRMGPEGDFSITTNGTGSTADIAFPWFTHQHDPEFELQGSIIGGRRVMTVYDNGDTRQANFNASANSRCQLYAVDEANRTVNLNVNGDVGQYSFALGSAQLLSNGNIHCNSGAIGLLTSGFTLTTEHDQASKLVYSLRSEAGTYRSFRMKTMYTPPTP